MKRAVFAVLVWLLVNASLAFAASRDSQWKEVEEAINKGLPKTAIEKLEPIIQGALKDKAWGEATKAIARRIVLEGNIQGNKPEEKITRLETEIGNAPKEIVPLLDTILANWYWHYFQQNRWRFMRRTQSAQPPGKDFTTWDLPRLFAEIDKQFQKALANADTLKKMPGAAFDDLLVKHALPDPYRPTLYDFIAHEALKFYSSGEQAAAKPEDAFELSADSPIFDGAEKFAAWDVERAAGILPADRFNLAAGSRQHADADSPILKALRLYQDLLKFHQNDNDPSAFIDVNIDERARVIVVLMKLKQVLIEPERLENGGVGISVLPASRRQIEPVCRQDAGSTLDVPGRKLFCAVENRTVGRKLEGVLRLCRCLFARRVELQCLVRDEVVEGGPIGVRQRVFDQQIVEGRTGHLLEGIGVGQRLLKLLVNLGEESRQVPSRKILAWRLRRLRAPHESPAIVLEKMPVPNRLEGIEQRRDFLRCLGNLGLHPRDSFLRFVALDVSFENNSPRDGLGRLAPCLVLQGALDDRFQLFNGCLG